jgi:hypothetical protein
VESSGRGVVSPGGVFVRGRNTLRIQPGQTMRWLHSLDVPSRGPVHAATRWETRPTSCCFQKSRDARGRQTVASFGRYISSLHERNGYSVCILAGGVNCLSTIPAELSRHKRAKTSPLVFTREPSFEFRTSFSVANHRSRRSCCCLERKWTHRYRGECAERAS